ncbi:MAG: hypothetical protein ACI84S_000966, partial [Thalassomonas sp.]
SYKIAKILFRVWFYAKITQMELRLPCNMKKLLYI